MNCHEFEIVSRDDAKAFYWNFITNCYKAFEKAGGCECSGYNLSNPDCTATTNEEFHGMFTEECIFWESSIYEYCDARKGKPSVLDQYTRSNKYGYIKMVFC